MQEPVAFFDVDTQIDFMLPHGNLYVPGAEKIIPNLVRLMAFAREHDIPVISSADAHTPDDPEFKIWPPHCVIGTPGQKRIPETQLPGAVVVPSHASAFTPPDNSLLCVAVFLVENGGADSPLPDLLEGVLGRRPRPPHAPSPRALA